MFNFGINHTLCLILITTLVSLLAFRQSRIMSRLIFWSPAIRLGQVDRFITYGFVHADGFHLLFNMITLFFFGSIIEQFYRQYAFNMGFALFYLGGLIFSMLPSYFKHRHDQHWMSLGASGAVSAVLFAYILFQPWKLILVFFIPVPAIIFAILYIAYSIWAEKRGNTGVSNHSAHLWGALYGVVCTVLLQPQILQHFFYSLIQPSF